MPRTEGFDDSENWDQNEFDRNEIESGMLDSEEFLSDITRQLATADDSGLDNAANIDRLTAIKNEAIQDGTRSEEISPEAITPALPQTAPQSAQTTQETTQTPQAMQASQVQAPITVPSISVPPISDSELKAHRSLWGNALQNNQNNQSNQDWAEFNESDLDFSGIDLSDNGSPGFVQALSLHGTMILPGLQHHAREIAEMALTARSEGIEAIKNDLDAFEISHSLQADSEWLMQRQAIEMTPKGSSLHDLKFSRETGTFQLDVRNERTQEVFHYAGICPAANLLPEVQRFLNNKESMQLVMSDAYEAWKAQVERDGKTAPPMDRLAIDDMKLVEKTAQEILLESFRSGDEVANRLIQGSIQSFNGWASLRSAAQQAMQQAMKQADQIDATPEERQAMADKAGLASPVSQGNELEAIRAHNLKNHGHATVLGTAPLTAGYTKEKSKPGSSGEAFLKALEWIKNMIQAIIRMVARLFGGKPVGDSLNPAPSFTHRNEAVLQYKDKESAIKSFGHASKLAKNVAEKIRLKGQDLLSNAYRTLSVFKKERDSDNKDGNKDGNKYDNKDDNKDGNTGRVEPTISTKTEVAPGKEQTPDSEPTLTDKPTIIQAMNSAPVIRPDGRVEPNFAQTELDDDLSSYFNESNQDFAETSNKGDAPRTIHWLIDDTLKETDRAHLERFKEFMLAQLERASELKPSLKDSEGELKALIDSKPALANAANWRNRLITESTLVHKILAVASYSSAPDPFESIRREFENSEFLASKKKLSLFPAPFLLKQSNEVHRHHTPKLPGSMSKDWREHLTERSLMKVQAGALLNCRNQAHLENVQAALSCPKDHSKLRQYLRERGDQIREAQRALVFLVKAGNNPKDQDSVQRSLDSYKQFSQLCTKVSAGDMSYRDLERTEIASPNLEEHPSSAFPSPALSESDPLNQSNDPTHEQGDVEGYEEESYSGPRG